MCCVSNCCVVCLQVMCCVSNCCVVCYRRCVVSVIVVLCATGDVLCQ